MIKFYIPDSIGGGGGEKPQQPENYKPLNPVERQQWNNFLDYLDKRGVGGSKDLDKRDQSLGLQYMKGYKKDNPDFSLDEKDIPRIQYDQYLLRKGDSYPTLNSSELQYVRKGLNPAYMAREVSPIDGWMGSITSKLYYPTAKRVGTGGKDYGTDFEGFVKPLGLK